MIQYLRVVAVVCLIGLALCLPKESKSQSLRWSTDSILYEYEGCQPDTTITFWLINDGNEPELIATVNDVVPYWQIVQTPMFPITLAAHDSVRFVYKAKHVPYPGLFHGTLSPNFEQNNLLTIDIRHHGPALVTDPITVQIDSIVTGDTVLRTVLLTNEGTRDFTLRSLTTSDWFPHVSMTGLALGDVIPPGGSRTILLKIWAQGRQPVFGLVNLNDLCYTRGIQVSGSFKPSGPQWVDVTMDDHVQGCDTGSVHTLVVMSDHAEREQVDSIRFGADMEGWSFVDGPIDRFEIKSGSDFHVRLHRGQYATATGMVILFPHGRPTDTAWIELDIESPFIAFKAPYDTMIYEIDPGKQRNLSFFVQNQGKQETWLEDITITHNDGWQLLSFDAGVRLGFFQSSAINFSFAGTQMHGDYPITFTVRNKNCLQAITQTLIARVGIKSGVTDAMTLRDVSVYPSPATSRVIIASDGAIHYTLFDLLGREMMTGVGDTRTTINVSTLPRASYILAIESNGKRTSRMIQVVE